MSHVFAVLLFASLFPNPILKKPDTQAANYDFFNSSRVCTREASAVPERLKAGAVSYHGCLVHFLNNGSCAFLLAMELEKLLVNGKITVTF